MAQIRYYIGLRKLLQVSARTLKQKCAAMPQLLPGFGIYCPNNAVLVT